MPNDFWLALTAIATVFLGAATLSATATLRLGENKSAGARSTGGLYGDTCHDHASHRPEI